MGSAHDTGVARCTTRWLGWVEMKRTFRHGSTGVAHQRRHVLVAAAQRNLLHVHEVLLASPEATRAEVHGLCLR